VVVTTICSGLTGGANNTVVIVMNSARTCTVEPLYIGHARDIKLGLC